MKTCKICAVELPLARFDINKTYKSGRDARCKECKGKLRRQRYQENREYELDRNKRWAKSNAEKVNAIARRTYWKNRDKRLEENRKWQKANAEHCAEKERRRRASIRNQVGYMPDGWLDAMKRVYGHRCAQCGTSENVTIDHVIPLANGGFHEISNLQFLCGSHNSAKRNHRETDYRCLVLVDTVTT